MIRKFGIAFIAGMSTAALVLLWIVIGYGSEPPVPSNVSLAESTRLPAIISAENTRSNARELGSTVSPKK